MSLRFCADSQFQLLQFKPNAHSCIRVTTLSQRTTNFQGRIKLFGAPRQWKHFRPLFQAVFLSGGGGITPQTVKHHASQSQDRNNKYFILYIEFCINNKI